MNAFDCLVLESDFNSYFRPDAQQQRIPGGYGTVYFATVTEQARRDIPAIDFPEVVAVKVIKLKPGTNRAVLKNEIDMLKSMSTLSLPVVQYFGCYRQNNTIALIMERVSGDSLAEMLDNAEKYPEISLEDKYRIARDLAYAIHGLHRAGIVHRDIKPDNIMVSLLPHFRLKLIDFGFACDINLTSEVCQRKYGTDEYYDAQIIPGDFASMRAGDWYAYAITVMLLYAEDFSEIADAGQYMPEELAPILDIATLDNQAERPKGRDILALFDKAGQLSPRKRKDRSRSRSRSPV
jgi:serine/threonine protein kinase